MSQFTQLRDQCSDFGLTTELALSPTEGGEKNFEMIVDFDSGQIEPEAAIATIEQEFDVSMYDASASRHEHTLTGEYVLALSA